MTQYQPATDLNLVYANLDSGPLTELGQYEAFYCLKVNQVRGEDQIARLQLGLQRAHKAQHFFKACLIGHRGVGKSTELTRLSRELSETYQVIRFSAVTDLDPINFQPLDVIYLMMVELVTKTHEITKRRPSRQRLQEILSWFCEETTKTTSERESTLELEGGAGISDDSLWSKVLNITASLKAKLRFSANETTEKTTYHFKRIDDLIELVNALLDECTSILRESEKKSSWLFIGEDFDREAITSTQIEGLFIRHSAIFTQLRVSMIFTLPVEMYYSEVGRRLPFDSDKSILIPDTPVFNQEHQLNPPGSAAVEEILAARMSLELFESGQYQRLILASGGNIRDLFSLVNYAADTALLRGASTISSADGLRAILNLRAEYERRLGQSPYDREKLSYEEKTKCLQEIYAGKKIDQVPNLVHYALLRARAIQEFNGNRWFGVHPLVVNILGEQEKLTKTKDDGVPGGAY